MHQRAERHPSDLVSVVLGGAALVVLVLGRAWSCSGAAVVALVVAVVTVPLVLVDARERRLPNAFTGAILLAVLASAIGAVLAGRVPGEILASLVTALVLGLLHAVGGLGLGDVKLGAALAFPLAAIDPARAFAGPALAFLLAGCWALPLLRLGNRTRIPFGPFQLAGFWLVVAV